MNCTDIEIKLVDYIDGILSDNESKEIQIHINSCNSCKNELNKTTELFKAFNDESVAKPSSNLRLSFEKMLEREKNAQVKIIPLEKTKKSAYKSILQIAASIAILLTGYLFGGYQESKNTQQEIANYQQKNKENMLLAMIDNSSPSKRIKAVNYTEELTTPDTKILEALIDRMQNDSNSNVRLTAVEALSKFTNSELVKKSLIETLATEKDPSIQIEVIQILVSIQEKRALEPMKKLLDQPESPEYLKTQVNIGIAQLI